MPRWKRPSSLCSSTSTSSKCKFVHALSLRRARALSLSRSLLPRPTPSVALKKALVLLTHDSAKLTNAAGVVASATRSAEQEKSSATAEAKEGRAAKAKTGKAVDTLNHATKKIASEAARYIAKLATAKKAAAKAVKKEATKHKKAETKERNKFAKECAKVGKMSTAFHSLLPQLNQAHALTSNPPPPFFHRRSPRSLGRLREATRSRSTRWRSASTGGTKSSSLISPRRRPTPRASPTRLRR